jgi:phosphotransferase system  glucose/maltose/N-acetylglucosamine-specific IIC component
LLGGRRRLGRRGRGILLWRWAMMMALSFLLLVWDGVWCGIVGSGGVIDLVCGFNFLMWWYLVCMHLVVTDLIGGEVIWWNDST